jgi:hypothetical protein
MRGRFLPSCAELEAEVVMASDGGVGVGGGNCCSAQQWRRLRHLTLADGRQKRKKGTTTRMMKGSAPASWALST